MKIKSTAAKAITLMVLGSTATMASANETITYPKGDFCVISAEIPFDGAKYKKSDHKTEKKLCNYYMDSESDGQAPIDQTDVALCPKLFSSSPAVEVFKIPEGTSKSRLQNRKCNWSVGDKTRGFKKRAKYKYDIAGQSISSMMGYYHISRALKITAVPVSLYRTLNKKTHIEVAVRGDEKNDRKDSSLARYWKHIRYAFSGDIDKRFVTSDGQYSFGALSENPTGEQKYYEDFWPGAAQKKGITAFKSKNTYRRLGLKKPVSDFIGTDLTDQNLQQIQALKDASNMMILDSIFGQGDRFGNIHAYHMFMVPQEDGSLKKFTLKDVQDMIEESGTAAEQAEYAAAKDMANDWKKQIMKRNKRIVRVARRFLERIGMNHAYAQQMYLKDNDAGLVNAVNPFKERRMIEGVYHVSESTYTQLVKLYDAVKSGELTPFLTENLKMNSKERSRFLEGLTYVAENLMAKDRRGELYLDLNVKSHFKGIDLEPSTDGNLRVIKRGVRLRNEQILTKGLVDSTLLINVNGTVLTANPGDILTPQSPSQDVKGTPMTKVKVLSSRTLPAGLEFYIWTEALL